MDGKPFALATERNCKPILDVLQQELKNADTVLEIGSGTGQHAVALGAALDHLTWQTSDLDEHHAGIRAWLADAELANVLEPLLLDVSKASLPPATYDAVFSANTAHIMNFASVERMFALVAVALKENGLFCLYGPFRQAGEFNTASNAEFHRSLQARDPAMGIRHLEDLDRFATIGGMRRLRLYAMPANNYIVVWQKSSLGDNNDNA